MEWAERFAKEKADPGHETAQVVSTIGKGYPGLQDRWDLVASAIEDARKTAQTKTDPSPVPAPVQGGRVGILSVTKFGIFLKLDPDAHVAKGDILELFREGASVGEVQVSSTHSPDATYPNGSAECKKGTGTPQKGDEVRRKK
jgi:hypothetical protein